MIKNFLIIAGLLIHLSLSAQSLTEFESDFETACKSLSGEELDKMLSKHSRFLTPHIEVFRRHSDVDKNLPQWPLGQFAKKKSYRKNIDKLFYSEEANQRILSYLTVAGAGDRSYERPLLDKMKNDSDATAKVWAAVALMYLGCDHTTPLFKVVLENQVFANVQMLPLLFRLNPDSLQQTAFQEIKSDDVGAQVLAAQVMSQAEPEAMTEYQLKEAVRKWDLPVKGYAIYSIKELQLGELLNLLKPLLEYPETRAISLEALANSPTPADREYLLALTETQKTIEENLLNSFFQSKNAENVKYWLGLLSSKTLPADYTFFTFSQPLLSSDELLEDVQDALEKIQSPNILLRLSSALTGRSDKRSVRILAGLLAHRDQEIRYEAAKALEGVTSPVLKDELPRLLLQVETRTPPLTGLAIQNNISNYHPVFEAIYIQSGEAEWKRSALSYLTAFPLDKHTPLFKEILQNNQEELAQRERAALGLARLGDESGVPLITQACLEETAGGDQNAKTFLTALGMIKGKVAKKQVERYKKSNTPEIRDLAKEILANW